MGRTGRMVSLMRRSILLVAISLTVISIASAGAVLLGFKLDTTDDWLLSEAYASKLINIIVVTIIKKEEQ